MDSPTPVEPPPPAYTAEDHREFDRKISDALQRSLQFPPSSPNERTAEEWSDAGFAAAARAHQHCPNAGLLHRRYDKERGASPDVAQPDPSSEASSSSSRRPHARTGNLSRRLPPHPVTAKERPNWFAQAQLDSNPPTTVHQLPEEDDEPDEQLPGFTAIGLPLEGPPYEEVVRIQPRAVDPGDSPPQSPLDSVDSLDSSPLRHLSFPDPPRSVPRERYVRENVPRPPSVTRVVRSVSTSAVSVPPPPIHFDPAIAYTEPRSFRSFSESSAVDPSALYNSAVSPFIGASTPQLPKKTNTFGRRSLSLAVSRPVPHTPCTSNPYAPLNADSLPQVPQPYQSPLSSTQAPLHGAYPSTQISYPAQRQPYYPPQQTYPTQQTFPYRAPTAGPGSGMAQWTQCDDPWDRM